MVVVCKGTKNRCRNWVSDIVWARPTLTSKSLVGETHVSKGTVFIKPGTMASHAQIPSCQL